MKLKGNNAELEISVLGRENPKQNDYWEGNWLISDVRVEVGGFKANYRTNLRAEDLDHFYKAFLAVQNGKTKEFKFTTMEEGLYLHCELEYNGEIMCTGKADNHTGSYLNFKIGTDTISKESFMIEIQQVLQSYPGR